MFSVRRCSKYNLASYAAFTAYAICSLIIPLALVQISRSLAFPLEAGGMGRGGALQLIRSGAKLVTLAVCCRAGAKFGNRRVLGWSMLLAGAGILICSAASCYAMLLPGLLLAGLGEGLIEGLGTPFVQELHPDAPEKYVSIAHSFWSVGIAVCVIGGGALLQTGVSWRIVLMLAGLAALTAAAGFTGGGSVAETSSCREDNLKTTLRRLAEIARRPRFWVYCLAMFIGAGAEFGLTFWSASFLQLRFRSSALLSGLGTGVIAAGMFLGRMAFGWIARGNRLKYILLGASLGTVIPAALLPLMCPEFFASPGAMYAALFILLFICGIGIAPYWPILQVYGVKQLPELDGTLLYICFSAVGIPGSGFFTWLLGMLGDRFGTSGAFAVIPVTLLGYAAIIFTEGWIFPRRTPLPEK